MKKLLTLVALCVATLTAGAATWNVAPDNNPEAARTDCNLYVTIVRVAADGDTIVMADGTYIETLSVPRGQGVRLRKHPTRPILHHHHS